MPATSPTHGILLGTGLTRSRPDACTVLPPRTTVLLHTDGLVESPHRSIDHGLDRLRRHVASLAAALWIPSATCYWSRSAPATTTTTSPMLALRTPAFV
ncbi:hypothetical protein AB0D42_19650 [Streptomyces sp. NPDC048304]|uniref:hypothetical protein n=1 Tax=Streptomyces sp. NPDC048304 TaxID=3154820 RepID=UPI0033C5D176